MRKKNMRKSYLSPRGLVSALLFRYQLVCSHAKAYDFDFWLKLL